MPLNSVRSADHKNRIIQNLQRPLHLRAEIHMSRRIQKRDIHLLPGQTGLLGKNGDPPLPLQGKIVQTGVPVIHPSQSLDLPAGKQKPLCQSGLSRIHMGKQANTYLLFICFIFLSAHGNASFTQIHTFPVYHRNIC